HAPSRSDASHTHFFIPAPAGTEWQVAAGYNTATHIGEDPYALDIVRADGPTEGTLVLSPIDGKIGFVSDTCVGVATDHNLTVLLCHLFHKEGLRSNTPVLRGEALGIVAPPGAAGNNGLAHIQ